MTRPAKPTHIKPGDAIRVRWGRWVDYPLRGWAVDAGGYTDETVDPRGWSYDEGMDEWCVWVGPTTRKQQSDVVAYTPQGSDEPARPMVAAATQGTLW